MNDEQIMRMMEIRASDARSIILPFTLSHAAILIILGFGGDGLDNSGVQLAIAAMAVLGSLWCVGWLDDCMQDLIAGGKDCLLYTSPSPRDISGSRMPSSA